MRAIRRHHRERLKRKRRYFWGHSRDLWEEPRYLGMAVSTPKVCTCWMCGNPRRWHDELTMQERRSNDGLRYGIETEFAA